MNKNTMYGLLACAVIALGAGAFWMVSQDTPDGGGASFKTQSVSSFDCATAQTGIPISECEALVALYYNTNGDSWSNKENWLNITKPVINWYGVTVSNGHVTELALYNNQLSGLIPNKLSQLTNLTKLRLSYNQLSGPIPAELGQLTNLKFLQLSHNQLSGPIPSQLGQLTNLIELYLGNNKLSGSIPSELSLLVNVNGLTLNDNQLSGPIPKELKQLNMMKHLWLHNNQLSGPIPSELSLLTNSSQLTLQNNQLCGALPNSFMFNGTWRPGNPDGISNIIRIKGNNLLDDQGSYSVEMWDWMKSKGFVDANSNRIPEQTPDACGDTGAPGLGESCVGEAGECAEGYCHGYQPGACTSNPLPRASGGRNGTDGVDCEKILNDKECKEYYECTRQEEQPGICKEEICGDGILDPREQCDGKGQAQCSKGATCSTTGKAPCTCQYSEVIGPDKLPDTTGDGDGKLGTNEDTPENYFPTRDLTR